MEVSLSKKIAIAVMTCCVIAVSLQALLTKPVSKDNVKMVVGHFRNIEAKRASRGSLYYELFIQEDNNTYRVIADWTNCFAFEKFVKEVGADQFVKISIRDNNGFLSSSDHYIVTSIIANDRNYMDVNCINKRIIDGKFEMAAFAIAMLIIAFLVFQYEKENRKKKTGYSKTRSL